MLCGSAGPASCSSAHACVTTFHSAATSGDDILRQFWEIEEAPTEHSALSVEERMVCGVLNQTTHAPKKEDLWFHYLAAKQIGESRSQAVSSLERSLTAKGCFKELDAVMQEYLDLGHAEPVPSTELGRPIEETFYLPTHAVYKATSTTTRVRAVFDASAKSSTGVSLNDTLLVGPTVHPPLIDVILRFRSYPAALTADVSKMYRAIELARSDRDLHRFVWRSNPNVPLTDHRMTRVTFGVSSSSFAANMAVKQNAIDHAQEVPLAAKIARKCFYVDDCLTGADDPKSALALQQQLTSLFACGGFLLRK